MYNVGTWLERCLSSLIQQGMNCDDYEILLVDDGSTDDTIECAEAYLKSAGEMIHWKLLTQNHGGPSGARNYGLREATGDYIWWVDADDFLEPGMASQLIARAEQDRLDLIGFGLYIYEEDGTKEVYPIGDATGGAVVDGPTFLQKVGMAPSPWSAIYRREFLLNEHLDFLEGVCAFEDQDFTMRAFFLAQRCAFQDLAVYNYFQREGSIMKSENLKKTDDLVLICHRLHDFAQKHTKAGTPIREVFENRIAFLFSQALANLCRCGKDTFPGDLKKLPFFPLKINDSESKRLRYKYRLINLSVPLYLKLYRKFAEKPETKPGLKELRTK